jgi:AcrR family transcriptional regulator
MRKRYHHGDLRQSLIDAALAELDERGELPSWRALARACAVSQTAPYRHFDSFETLQAAVVTAAFGRLNETILEAAAGIEEPFARLAAGLRAYIEFGCRHASWYELMFGRNLALLKHEEVAAAGRAAYATLTGAIADCGVATPDDIAFTVWSALHGVADLVGNGLSPPDAGRDSGQRAVDGLIDMCVAHVRCAATADRPDRGGPRVVHRRPRARAAAKGQD